MLGGYQNRSGRLGEEKYFLSLPWIEPQFFGLPARSKITVTVLRESVQDDGLFAGSHENITGAQQVESLPFLGIIEKLRTRVLVSSYLFVSPSVRMK
jgi:hypothetical protein